MKAEKMLKIAADSWKMPGWNDTLSMVVDSAMPKTGLRALSDEDLQLVAEGGTHPPPIWWIPCLCL